jgi:type III secretion system HrpE/YscL family protein
MNVTAPTGKALPMRLASARVISADDAVQLMSAVETLRRAREEAAALMLKANEESRILRESAVADGRREGVMRYQEELFLLEASRKTLRDSLTGETISHVFAVIEQLLPHIPKGAITENLVRDLLKRVRGSGAVELRVNPEQIEFCQISLASWTDGAPMPVNLKADPSLANDECVIVGDSGSLKASLSEQIKALQHTIRANLQMSEAA